MLLKNKTQKQLLSSLKIVAVDVNKDRFVCSDGRMFCIKHFNEELGIPEMRRQISTLKEGTDDYKKLNQKIGRACRQAQRQRKRFYEEMVKEIVLPDTDAVAIENLNIKDMFDNADNQLFQDLLDIGFGVFIKEMHAHCRKNNIPLVKVRQYEPSSQTCSYCSAIFNELGKKKQWKCTICGTEHDRDYNASLNIKEVSIKNLKKEKFNVINFTPVSIIVPSGGFETCEFAIEAKTNMVLALSDSFQIELYEKLKELYSNKKRVEEHPYFGKRSFQFLLDQMGIEVGSVGLKPGSPVGEEKTELRWLLIQLGYPLEYYVENGKTTIPSVYFLKEVKNE